uniref:Receptor expression-enhancing protein n=1 Tax=Panagrellus redivivus TaxID=6233 RepID=A0A7E4VSG8_PANRE
MAAVSARSNPTTPGAASARKSTSKVSAVKPADAAAAAAAAAPAAAAAAPAAADAAGEAQSFAELRESFEKGLYNTGNPILEQQIVKAEQATGAKREHMAYGVLGVLGVYLIFGSLAQLVCNLIGFGYPAHMSVKAVRTEGKDDDTQWLIYWTVFAFFSLLDFFAEGIMSFFPIYWLAKALFLLYCALPQTRGAIKLYAKVVEPAMLKLDAVIEKYTKSA